MIQEPMTQTSHVAGEWLGTLEQIRMRMRTIVNESGESEDTSEQYFTVEPVTSELPDTWQYTLDEDAERRQAKRLTLVTVPMALLGGLLGATAATLLWAVITYTTGRQFDFLALGAGILTGMGAVWVSDGRRGPIVQLLAVVGTLAAFIVGKYVSTQLMFAGATGTISVDGFLASLQASLPFSGGLFSRVLRDVQGSIQPTDLLIIVLMIWLAWRMAASTGVPQSRRTA